MRRHLDFYPTPEWATETLMNHVGIVGHVVEPCAGDNAIARVLDERLRESGNGFVYTSDIDGSRKCQFQGDASDRVLWGSISNVMPDYRIDWVVTNPPFSVAAKIIPLAYEFADKGIAMLLRLSYLEPVEDRGAWLNAHPPTDLIVTPRISFTCDGKTDNVTTAWMIWEKGKQGTITVAENPRFTQDTKSPASGALSNDTQREFFAS